MKKIKFDIGKALVNGAATFQAYQFGRALNVYDPAGWNVRGVNAGGLMLGVIVNVVVALATTRLPGIKGKTRAWSAWGGFAVLLLLSPSLVAPALYLLLKNLDVLEGMRIFLAIGLASAPDVAIALGGFIAGKSLISLGDSERPQIKSLSGSSGAAGGRSAKKGKRSAEQANVPCRYAGAGCERVGTQNAMNAHARTCKFKPLSQSTQKIIQVDTSEVKK